jgi:pectate lyase
MRLGPLPLLAPALMAIACSAPGYVDGFTPNPNQRDGVVVSSDVQLYTDAPIGWASVADLGLDGTTGGGAAAPVMVATLMDLTTAVAGTAPAVVQLGASITGSVKIGSNKTVLGAPGVVFTGHIGVSGSSNVIVRDLTIVGNNCNDNADCQSGADAVTIDHEAHHVWFDHCDVSDGSDGNLDTASAADYVTISWTKFWYSGNRPGGHQFSNLIGSSDSATGDAGHLRVTWHHDWWADHVGERMPRVRYGQVHLFNNLYTAAGNNTCVGLGVGANLLMEDEVFDGVARTIDLTHADASSVAVSFANVYTGGTRASAERDGAVFTPPYPYTLQSADDVEATVRAGAGPQPH